MSLLGNKPDVGATQIVAKAPFAIVSVDRQGHITSVNPATVQLFGHAESDLLGLPVSFLVPRFIQEECVDTPVIGLRKGGIEFCADLTFSNIQGDGGPGGVVFIRDASHLRRTESALMEAEEGLRLIMQSIAGFTWTADATGNVENINRGMLDYLGLPIESLMNSGWIGVIHPEDVDSTLEAWKLAVDTGCSYDVVTRIRRADNAYRSFRVSALPSRSLGGGLGRWYGVAIDIDDQKRAEESLTVRERELRVLVDAIPAMLTICSPNGEVEYVNKPALDLIGERLEVFKNLGWKAIIHPDDADDLADRWMAAVRAGEPLDAEYRQRHADGAYRWWHIRVNPLRNESRDIVRWYGVITDIDDRKRMEDALRASERSLRLMVDGVPGMLCVCAADGELEYVNQPMLNLMGHSLEEAKQLGWAASIHPEDRGDLVNRWKESIAAGRMLDYEYRRLCPDGTYRRFHVRMRPQFDDRGHVIRWYALITDIEDRILAQEARVNSERQARHLMESIPIGVWCAAPDGEIIYINKHLEDYKGIRVEDLKRDKYQYVHPDDVAVATGAWIRSVESGESFTSTHRTRRADGAYRWHLARADVVRDEDGSIIQWYGIEIDIHEYRSAEDALRFTEAKLARASQIATVAELSASIAHEINQPLAAVVSNGHACQQWLSANPPNISKALLTAERLVRDANSASEIVVRIRSLFERNSPAKVALDINRVIAEVRDLLADEVRRKAISVDTMLSNDLPLTLADKIQIQQVVYNLVRNAIDAMEVTVGRSKVLSMCSRLNDTNIVVEVCDEGEGTAHVQRVFEPFYTTKKAGMGIGLAVCRSIIDTHGGQIWAKQNEVRGMTFGFSIPVISKDLL